MKSLCVLGGIAAAFIAAPALASDRGSTDYTFAGTFAPYSNSIPFTLTGTFTYNQAAGGLLEAFSLDVGSTHFDLTNVGIEDAPSYGIIFIGGDPSGVSTLDTIGRGADDFRLALHVVPGTGYLAESNFAQPFGISLYNPNIVCGETRGGGDPCYEYHQGAGSTDFTLTEAPHADAVPEPATWAMMLLGFGAVGYGMRRRRQTASAHFRAA